MQTYATKNTSGAYDVYQGGQKVSTGSSAVLGNYGLSEDSLGTAPQPTATQPTQTLAPASPTYSASGGAVLPTMPSPAPAPTTVKAPQFPSPQAPQQQESFVLSATEQAKQARTAIEDAYKGQIDKIDRDIDDTKVNIAGITAKQEDIISNDIDPLLQPFRQQLETSERDRLKVEDNYFANQTLVGELEQLLTEGNTLIRQQQGLPVHQRVVNARANKAIEDVAARAGVIQAVMSARNNQIAQAYNLIDRSVSAITADRQDRLTYYNTLLDFYQNAKDDEGKKLAGLSDDKKKIIDGQIGLLKDDLDHARANADYIKKLMVTPDSALFMARAGITLNDTPEDVNRKMAEQTQREEIEELTNNLTAKGYTQSPVPSAGAQAYQVGGKTLYFKPPVAAAGSAGSSKLSSAATISLLGAGFTEQEAQAIDADIRAYGLDAVLSDPGLTPSQQEAIRKNYKAESGGITLTRESVATLYGLTDDDTRTSWWGMGGDTNKEKLDAIIDTIERYRAVGYSDADILKKLESAK